MAEETRLHETLLAPFCGSEWSRLVLTLGHSLWRGAAVIVILALILRYCDGRKSQIRYALCVTALLAVPQTSILTWSWFSHVDNGTAAANTGTSIHSTARATEVRHPSYSPSRNHLCMKAASLRISRFAQRSTVFRLSHFNETLLQIHLSFRAHRF